MFVVETLGGSFPDGSVVKNLPANAGNGFNRLHIVYKICKI